MVVLLIAIPAVVGMFCILMSLLLDKDTTQIQQFQLRSEPKDTDGADFIIEYMDDNE